MTEINQDKISPRWSRPAAAVALAGAAVLLRFTACAPPRISTIHPRNAPLVAEVFGTGTLEAKVVVSLGAKITGKVAEILADQGDRVKAGQVVARLEAADFENAVRVAEAGVGQAQAERDKAELDIGRKRRLLAQYVISKADYDGFEAADRVAAARLENARAQLGFARARLADTVIRSPVAGIVVTRNLEREDTVVPGTPIFRIADTSVVWVAATVDERVAGGLRPGQPARIVFRARPSDEYPGELARLSQEADRVAEEREADVRLTSLPPNWFFGSKADVYIETGRKADSLQVPRAALAPRGAQPGVFVIESGRARWRPVRIGLGGRDAVEVLDGLAEADRVAATPFAGKKPLGDGDAVSAGMEAR